MGNIKIISIAVICFVFCACNEGKAPKDMVSLQEYEATIQEYKELNQKQAAIIQKNIENEAVINEVIKELRAITSSTANLRIDIEIGSATEAKPTEIKRRLEELKQKLSTVKKQASTQKERQYLATIQNLQKIIEQKEIEVETLTNEIINKDNEISHKQNIILAQEDTINSQQNEMIKQQMDAWFSMGCELYYIYELIPSVKGKKDNNNMSDLKIHILRKAKDCFIKASLMGHSAATNQVDLIDHEIQRL